MRLQDKVAIITGSARGIGRATALAFAAAGAQVIVCDMDVAGGEQTAADIRAAGGRALFVQVNVTERASVDARPCRAPPPLAPARRGGGFDLRGRQSRLSSIEPAMNPPPMPQAPTLGSFSWRSPA